MSQQGAESRYAVIPSDAVDDPDLTLSDIRVLGVIGYHANRKRPAWPRQQTIAERLGLARETVNRSVRRLWRKGYIDIAHQYRDDGGQRESYYFVRLDPDVEVQPVEVRVRGKTLRLEQRVTQPSHPHPSQGKVTSEVTGPTTQPGHTAHDVGTSHLEEQPRGTTKKNITPNPKGKDDRDHSSKPKRSIAAPVKAEFDQLWKLWPAKGRERSKSRDLCLQAFAKACDQVPPPHVVEAAAAFVAKQRDPAYTPGLDRWLAQGRYEHFLPAAAMATTQPELPLAAAAPAPPDGIDWDAAVQRYIRGGIWPRHLDDRPDEYGYRGPLAPLEAVFASGRFGMADVAGLKANIDRLRADQARRPAA